MAKKQFTYRGKTIEELMAMNLKDFAQLTPARQRRSLEHGLSDQQKKLLLKIKKTKEVKWNNNTQQWHAEQMFPSRENFQSRLHILSVEKILLLLRSLCMASLL